MDGWCCAELRRCTENKLTKLLMVLRLVGCCSFVSSTKEMENTLMAE